MKYYNFSLFHSIQVILKLKFDIWWNDYWRNLTTDKTSLNKHSVPLDQMYEPIHILLNLLATVKPPAKIMEIVLNITAD